MRSRWRLHYFIGILAIGAVTIAGWIWREAMNQTIRSHPAITPSILIALVSYLLLSAVFLVLQESSRARALIKRSEQVTGFKTVGGTSTWARMRNRLPDPLGWITRPALSTPFGQDLRRDWLDSGWGTRASRAFLLLMFSAIGAGFIGLRVGGWILAAFFAPLAFVLARRVIKSRATASRQQLTMQLPYALDSLASGISAGLTFQQAVSFASQELPEPSAGAMRRLHLRMALGHPVEKSISALSDFYSDEAFALAIDGIILQRQFGGNLIAHLEESAALLRDRMELQQEVQSITAQGRLSGWVIGALVPVSAGILLAFNPQYINVLFDTLIGQLVLITVILLQVIGWTIISRLVRVRY